MLKKVFYFKPESGVHVTEMMTYDSSMITAYVLMCFLVVILLQITNSSSTSLSVMFTFAPEILIRAAYGTKNRGARKRSRFVAPFSGACVMGIR